MSEHEEEQVTQNQEVETEGTESTDPKQNVISVENPSAEEMATLCENIKVNYDFDVVVKPNNFTFKKSTDKATGIETVRNAVQLAIAYPSMQGIVNILEKGGKGLELLVEALEDVVDKTARNILYEDLTLTAATFPVDKLSWEAIANMPKAQRKGGGIPKETWEAFAQDYVEVMPTATGKGLDQVTRAAKIIANKLSAVRTIPDVLNFIVEQLAVYADHSPNIEEYQDCVEFLLNKADTFLNVSSEDLLANL